MKGDFDPNGPFKKIVIKTLPKKAPRLD